MKTGIRIIFAMLIGISGSLSCVGCYAQHGNPVEGKFVFESTRAGNSRDVYVSNKGKVYQVAKKAFSPKWSPDGKLIACAVEGRFNAKGKDGILLIDQKGVEKGFIETDGVPAKISWGFRDDKIYFVLARKDKPVYSEGICSFDISTNKQEKVWSNEDDSYILYMDASPDGKAISYGYGIDVDSAVYVLDLASKKLKRFGGGGANRCWYPDSKHIAFITNLDENGQQINDAFGNIYKLNIETGEKTFVRVVNDLMLLGLKVSRDGKYFYYTLQSDGGGQRIYISPVDNPKVQIPVTEPVIKSTGYSQDWSPDWYQDE